jgi:hypothetical protein
MAGSPAFAAGRLVNREAASALGPVTLPASLARADEVIE